jgi:CDP-6-deoxy-D-xylo-4-hexulose-3-dehydrase
MQAAIGCAQLKKLPAFVEKRRHNFDRLEAALHEVSDKLIMPARYENSKPSWFGFPIIAVKELTGTGLFSIWKAIEYRPECCLQAILSSSLF